MSTTVKTQNRFVVAALLGISIAAEARADGEPPALNRSAIAQRMISQGEGEQKRKRYQEALGHWDSFLKDFKDDTAQSPETKATVRYNRACCLWSLNRFSDSIEACQSLLKDYPNFDRTNDCRYLLGLSSYQLARITRNKAEFKVAAVLLKEAQGPKALYYQAEALHQAGNDHDALIVFEQLLQEEPKHLDALYAVGVIYQGMGPPDKAISWFERFLIDHSRHELALEVHVRLGDLWASQGKPDKAEAAYLPATEAPSTFPWLDRASIGLADARRKLGKIAEADEVLRRLPAKAPARNEEASLRLVEALAPTSPEVAVEVATEALTRFPDGPRSSKILAIIGRAQFARKLDQQAVDAYREAARRDSKSLGFSDQFRLATALGRLKKHEEAVNACDRLLAEAPNYPDRDKVLYTRALEISHDQPKAEAIKALARVFEEFPNSPLAAEAQLKAALIHLSVGEIEPAESLLKAAQARASTEKLKEEISYRLAKSHFDREAFPEAATRFDEQVEDHPGGRFSVAGRFFAAESYLMVDNFPAAEERYAAVIAPSPSPYRIRALVGAGHAALGLARLDDADRWFKTAKAEADRPTDTSEARLGLGLVLEARNDHAAALTIYEELIALQSLGDVEARAMLRKGMILEALGKRREALAAYLNTADGYDAPGPCGDALFQAARLFENFFNDPKQARDCEKLLAERYPRHKQVSKTITPAR